MEFKYQIGDKTYIQKPLVIGQFRQFFNILKETTIPYSVADGDAGSLIAVFGDKIHLLLAIALTEEGTKLKDKNIDEFASEIEFEIDTDTTFQVVTDFFDCNDLPTILKKIGLVIEKVTEKIKGEVEETEKTD